MKRRILRACVAALLLAVMILPLAACGKEEVDWVTSSKGEKPITELSVSLITEDPESFGEGLAAPKFQTGKYITTCTDTQSFTYCGSLDDVAGTTFGGYYMTSKYIYDLDITVAEDGITAVFTFKDIYLDTYEDEDSIEVQLDTTDDSYRDQEDTKVYFDLLGQSFTVKAEPDGNIISIDGYDDIIAAVPAAGENDFLTEEVLLSTAGQIFHSMPDKFVFATRWQYTYGNFINNYLAARYARNKFGINIYSEDVELPAPFTTEDNMTISYETIEPLKGTLWMDEKDRGQQEYSAYMENVTLVTDADGYGYYLINCSISKVDTVLDAAAQATAE